MDFSNLMYEIRDYKKAKEGYKKILDIKKKNLKEGNLEYSEVLSIYSNALNKMGDFRLALEGYEEV